MIDVEELRSAPIAVLGGGALVRRVVRIARLQGKKFVSAILIPSSNQALVRRTDRHHYRSEASRHATKYGFARYGRAEFAKVTNSVAEAVKGAKLIVVGIPSIAHEVFFSALIPCLEDGQIIHIIPDNYGTLKLRKMMREAGCTKKVIVGGWSSAPYGTRVDTEGGIMNAHVSLVYRATPCVVRRFR